MTPADERLEAFRADFRGAQVPGGYAPGRHLFGVVAVCLVSVGFALTRVDQMSLSVWLMIPATCVLANLAEYLAHRYLMHQVVGPFAYLYRRHSGTHHRFFTMDRMSVDSADDFPAVIFPVRVSGFFLVGIAAPLAWGVGALLGAASGWVCLATSMSYYLSYELLHLGAHLPATHPWGRVGAVRWIRRHHGLHHDSRRMRAVNFNITVPLWDWLLGTFATAAAAQDDETRRERAG